jgi:hypothetical protein
VCFKISLARGLSVALICSKDAAVGFFGFLFYISLISGFYYVFSSAYFAFLVYEEKIDKFDTIKIL